MSPPQRHHHRNNNNSDHCHHRSYSYPTMIRMVMIGIRDIIQKRLFPTSHHYHVTITITTVSNTVTIVIDLVVVTTTTTITVIAAVDEVVVVVDEGVVAVDAAGVGAVVTPSSTNEILVWTSPMSMYRPSNDCWMIDNGHDVTMILIEPMKSVIPCYNNTGYKFGIRMEFGGPGRVRVVRVSIDVPVVVAEMVVVVDLDVVGIEVDGSGVIVVVDRVHRKILARRVMIMKCPPMRVLLRWMYRNPKSTR